MKYVYLFTLLLCFLVSSAQLTITNLSDNSQINDGDVILFDKVSTTPNPNDPDGKLKFKISNSSATETINVLGQIVSFTNTDGSGSQFCVQPSCFFDMSIGQNIPNNPLALAPGADNGDFDSFYNSNPGDGVNYPLTYAIRFYMVDDNGQEVGDDISITYSYTPANFSTSNFSLEDLGILLHSTVVSESLRFTFNTNVSLSIYDISGKLVDAVNPKAGEYNYHVSGLSSGNYILLFNDNKGRQTKARFYKK